ncbi:MAG: branched-chain amino acid ABC transporter permease [Ectothiorhodospiraceae bacterium]|nr:branched-chain amino acid ABC transporter permease [Ectothiorhodospiraceae bacterium]
MLDIPKSIRILLLLLTVLLACYPLWGEFFFGDRYEYYLQKLTFMMLLAILALSLDWLVGITGMVSIAQAAFFGVAGYTLVMLTPEFAAANVWVVLPAALVMAALAALVIGLLVIRTHGIFFIMATIAFSQMLYYLFHDAPFFGGSDGIYMFFRPEVSIGGVQLLNLEDRQTRFFIALVSLVAIYLLLRVMLRAPFGRVLRGIKENETRMRALGYNPLFYKLAAFVIAGTIAGYAGFLYTVQDAFVDPSAVSWTLSAHALVMVILGGLGTLFGPVLGAFAFEWLHYGFSNVTRHWELPLGIVVILMVLLLPRGIAGLLLDLSNRIPERKPDPAPAQGKGAAEAKPPIRETTKEARP